MIIFGKGNTRAVNTKLKHQVAKFYLDRVNGALCINQRLLEILGIKRGDPGYVVFIEDKGKIGIAYTDDKNLGLEVLWYKSDTRARMFNATMVEYFLEKYRLKLEVSSYHFETQTVPINIKGYNVYLVKEVTPYRRQKPSAS